MKQLLGLEAPTGWRIPALAVLWLGALILALITHNTILIVWSAVALGMMIGHR